MKEISSWKITRAIRCFSGFHSWRWEAFWYERCAKCGVLLEPWNKGKFTNVVVGRKE